jgi:HD superfamily phosphohydrolase YqeK
VTDRICALTVTLDEDIRVDDVESLMSAIRHMRHVAKVSPVVTEHVSAHAERIRIATLLHGKFKEIVDELWGR